MKDCGRHQVYLSVGAVLLAIVVLLSTVGGQVARAQTYSSSDSSASSVRWQLVMDGEQVEWPDTRPTAPLDSLQSVAERLLSRVQSEGFYYATLDTAVVDTSAQLPTVEVHVQRGPRVRIAQLQIEGTDAVPADELYAVMDTEEGDWLRPKRLEADIQALLDRYEETGRPLAQIRVAEADVTGKEKPALRVTLHVEEGPALWLKRIEVPEAARTSPALLAQLVDLDVGAPLQNYDPAAIRHALEKQDFLETVRAPELEVAEDGGAVLRIPVEEAAPGAFDVALGYLPPSGTRESGQLVGQGHLLLKHLFGGGRTADITLDRRPGQSSVFDISLSDPFVFGLPLRVEGRFRGEQRDSLYGERTYELQTGYRLGEGVEVTTSLSREVVRPGPAGRRLHRAEQRISRSSSLFYGIGVSYQNVATRQNPRQGISVSAHLEQGQKRRRGRRITSSDDTTRAVDALRQERLEGRIRGYLPLFNRHIVAVGGEGSVLLSRNYDRSDLFRLGGATSLRGYDEDRFLGNVVSRGFFEYRLQLDPASYAFAFTDFGYVSRPALDGISAEQGWHPGYGIGVQLQTAIGQITTTYALNPEVARPSNGRIHIGLSVGL